LEINITYRHMDSSPTIEEKINQKCSKLKKFFAGKMHVTWICVVDKDIHKSDVTIAGDHFTYHATAESNSLTKTLDDAIDKLERQLSKKKEQVKEKIHRGGKRPLEEAVKEVVDDESDGE